jgi:polyhydroxyalkanoate synthase
MASSNPFLPDLGSDAMTAVMADASKRMAGLNVPSGTLAQLQRDYLEGATSLWNQSLQGQGGNGHDGSGALQDRRFAAKEWAANPAAAYTAQMYLLNSRTLMRMAEAVEGDAKTKARLRFAVQQWIDAIAPSNFLALNPEAQQLALKTQGQSLAAGMVVFENELFQLIEYKPLSTQVYERPMLFVPPCINKFYIMDLQPDNSLIRYTVQQGHRVFVVSWRNPDASLADKTWDDYIEHAAIRAIDVVQELTGAKTINTLGFCVGGTIVATALAVLAARGRQPAHSVTLLTSLLDFSDTGVLDLFIDEAGVRLREMTLGDKSPTGPALLKGQELATTFSFLRPNDLVWNYVVGNYLKGEAPPAFDLLYWNGDATNLPGPMYCWYLRHTYLQDELKQPGVLTVCGEKLDLGRVKAPVFIYASREDHIVPWKAAYASTRVMSGKKRFVLGASGHIAGVINPPAKKKRNYWTSDVLPADADDWFEGATEVPGSWWGEWTGWLAPLSGTRVAAPKALGNRKYKPIEAAPGRYVKQKA